MWNHIRCLAALQAVFQVQDSLGLRIACLSADVGLSLCHQHDHAGHNCMHVCVASMQSKLMLITTSSKALLAPMSDREHVLSEVWHVVELRHQSKLCRGLVVPSCNGS